MVESEACNVIWKGMCTTFLGTAALPMRQSGALTGNLNRGVAVR